MLHNFNSTSLFLNKLTLLSWLVSHQLKKGKTLNKKKKKRKAHEFNLIFIIVTCGGGKLCTSIESHSFCTWAGTTDTILKWLRADKSDQDKQALRVTILAFVMHWQAITFILELSKN